MGWARDRICIAKAAFRKFVSGFETLIGLLMIQLLITLFCTESTHFDITTNAFSDGSLRLKYVTNDRAAEEFSLSVRQVENPSNSHSTALGHRLTNSDLTLT